MAKRRQPSRNEVYEQNLAHDEQVKRRGSEISPDDSYFSRFTAAYDDAEKSYKQGNFKGAASSYDAAIINGRLAKLTGIFTNRSSPDKGWMNKIKARRIDAKRRSNSGLTIKIASAIIGIGGIAFGLLFLSPNITGNVISELNQTSYNWIGIVSIVIGVVGAFSYFKS